MIYLFDIKEKLIKAVSNSSIITLEQRQSLTKDRYISDRVFAEVKALSSNVISTAQYLAIPSMNTPYRFHLFFISNLVTEGNATKIEGVSAGIEELRKTIVEDKRPESKTAPEVVSILLKGTNWKGQFTEVDNLRLSSNYYYIDLFEALKKVCKIYSLEMQFIAEIDGNHIGARVVKFSRQVGERSDQRIVYGKNALSIIHEEDRVSLYTALIGRGKALEVSSAEDNASGQAGYGRKLTFEDIEWHISQGKPVNKPRGHKFVEIPALTEKYGIKMTDGSMKPKVGVVEFEEEDAEKLLEKTYEELVKVSRPLVQYSAEVSHIKRPDIGNTVRVVRLDRGIDYETRIIELVLDRLSNRAIEVKIGDHIESSMDRVERAIQKTQEETQLAFNTYQNYVQDYVETTKETSYFTDLDPRENYLGKIKVGDLWYKKDPEHEGDTILYRWTGEVWEEVFRTYSDNQVNEAISEAEKKANLRIEEAKADILEENVTKLNQFKDSLSGFGENLLKGTRDFSGLWRGDNYIKNIKPRATIYDGFTILDHSSSWVVISQDIPVKKGEIYTFSFLGKTKEPGKIGIRAFVGPRNLNDVNINGINAQFIAVESSLELRRYAFKIEVLKDGTLTPTIEPHYNTAVDKTTYFGAFKLERGDIATPWTPHKDDIITEFRSIKSDFNQEMGNLRASVSSLSMDSLKKSELSITDEGITLASGKTVNGSTLASMIGVSPEGINIISNKVRIGGVNITDGAITSNKLSAQSIEATHLKSEAITAGALKVDQALVDKLMTSNLLANTLMTNTAMINHLKALEVVGDNIKGGKISGVELEILQGGLTIYNSLDKSTKVLYFDPLKKQYVFIGTVNATYGKIGGFNLWQNKYAKIFTPDDLGTAVCGMSDGINWLLYAGKNPNGTWDKADLDSAKFRLTRDGACYLRKAFLQNGSFVGSFAIFDGTALRADMGETTTFISGNHDHVFGVYNKGSYANWNAAKACIARNGQIKCLSMSQASDKRLKEVILTIDKEEAYRLIKDSHIVEYRLKSDESKKKHIGFIAQEIDELDTPYKEAILENHEGYYGASYIDYNNLSIAAMQHLMDKVEKLEREVEECKKKCTYKLTLWGSLLGLARHVKTKMMSTMGLWRRTRS